jgi:hypothetical protein
VRLSLSVSSLNGSSFHCLLFPSLSHPPRPSPLCRVPPSSVLLFDDDRQNCTDLPPGFRSVRVDPTVGLTLQDVESFVRVAGGAGGESLSNQVAPRWQFVHEGALNIVFRLKPNPNNYHDSNGPNDASDTLDVGPVVLRLNKQLLITPAGEAADHLGEGSVLLTLSALLSLSTLLIILTLLRLMPPLTLLTLLTMLTLLTLLTLLAL